MNFLKLLINKYFFNYLNNCNSMNNLSLYYINIENNYNLLKQQKNINNLINQKLIN
jgi:hypothetical protein